MSMITEDTNPKLVENNLYVFESFYFLCIRKQFIKLEL